MQFLRFLSWMNEMISWLFSLQLSGTVQCWICMALTHRELHSLCWMVWFYETMHFSLGTFTASEKTASSVYESTPSLSLLAKDKVYNNGHLRSTFSIPFPFLSLCCGTTEVDQLKKKVKWKPAVHLPFSFGLQYIDQPLQIVTEKRGKSEARRLLALTLPLLLLLLLFAHCNHQLD